MTASHSRKSSLDSPLESSAFSPDSAAQSRWGGRLSVLAAEASAPIIEPVEWQTKPTFWHRARRGVAVPATAAAAVFISIVIISVSTVWLRSHSLEDVSMFDDTNSLAFTDGSSGPAPADSNSTETGVGAAGNSGSGVGSAGSGGLGALGSKELMFVHVVGEVKSPGVYELSADARVHTAIEAAGGATDAAILSALNLARRLTDGEQVFVPNAENVETSAGGTSSGGVMGGAMAGSGAGYAAASGLVPLNTANQAELENLPRVGPALAGRIISWREANGGFQSTDQLLNVSGIGQKTFDQLRDLVTL